MKHRSYRGKVSYITDGVGEMGREWFHVTIQPDGSRTMRAVCEMDDDRLLRDVVMSVNADWQPTDTFVRLTIEEKFFGSSWFRFTDTQAECQGYTVKEGRIDQVFDTPERTASFGTHPVHSDAWGLAEFKTRTPGEIAPRRGPVFSSSHLPNGGSGPYLMPSPGVITRKYIGLENIEVKAGTFKGAHFQMLFDKYPPIDIWATPVDCIPIRLRWDLLKQTYDLVELSGDAR
ncbi:MAG: hypothetical protein SFV19_11020 [Rhodospirillaceae bacterium]|nr:hypothetical protein [Rhodospirillaceae bacterium]